MQRKLLLKIIFLVSLTGFFLLGCTTAYEYVNAGNESYHKGQYDQAIDQYTRAINYYGLREELGASSYQMRAHAYENKGQYNLAINDYTIAINSGWIKDKKTLALLYNVRAIWYKKIGNNELADKDLNNAKTILAMNDDAQQNKSVIVSATKPEMPETSSPTAVIKSDVDEIPSVGAKPNRNAYAIVIGIEQYRQKLPKADYAVSDAQLMSEYLSKVMGYPEENIVTITNEHATKSDFEKYFEQWLVNHVEKDSTVFIYFSGHGAPNPKTGDAYLVPYDGDPSFIAQTGYS